MGGLHVPEGIVDAGGAASRALGRVGQGRGDHVARRHLDPADLDRLGIASGSSVRVRSRRGAITLRAEASDAVLPGALFIPFHYREAAANVLTVDALDPFGKIPEFKFCAVTIEPV